MTGRSEQQAPQQRLHAVAKRQRQRDRDQARSRRFTAAFYRAFADLCTQREAHDNPDKNDADDDESDDENRDFAPPTIPKAREGATRDVALELDQQSRQGRRTDERVASKRRFNS